MRMYFVGIGSESMRSLSLALYRLEYVLKTPPKTPKNSAKSVIMSKYSQ